MQKKYFVSTVLILFSLVFFLGACRKNAANRPAASCHIKKIVNDVDTVSLFYDTQGRIIRIVSITSPEGNCDITYTGNLRIMETDTHQDGDYEKRIFTYDGNGNVVNRKIYYEFGNSADYDESIVTWNGHEIVNDSLFEHGSSAPVVTNYFWANGNIVRMERGNAVSTVQYDLTKLSQQGDNLWLTNEVAHEGFFIKVKNLIVSEQTVVAGVPEDPSHFTCSFDGDGKIISETEDGGINHYSYECN